MSVDGYHIPFQYDHNDPYSEKKSILNFTHRTVCSTTENYVPLGEIAISDIK